MNLLEAVATVTPKNFFQSRRESRATTEKGKRQQATIHSDNFLKALAILPRKDPLAGKYGILRIICGFPIEIELRRAFDAEEKDDREEASESTSVKKRAYECPDPDGTDHHPLGKLRTELLESITERFHPTQILNVIRNKALQVDESNNPDSKLVLIQGAPGIIGIQRETPSPLDEASIERAESVRRLGLSTLGTDESADREAIISALSEKDRIASRAAENVLAMLRKDHEGWGQRMELKRKHEKI